MSNSEENVLRVEQRVIQGGHYVPLKDIIRRYYRSKKMFMEIKDFVDNWILIFNGEDDFILVADNQNVYQPDLYRLFQEDIKDG